MTRSHPFALVAALSLCACSREAPSAPQPPAVPAPPVIAAVTPSIVLAGTPFPLAVAGANFGGAAAVGTAAPTLAVRRVRGVSGAPAGDAPVAWQVAPVEDGAGLETLRVDGPGTLAPGVYSVEVRTPEGGARTFDDAFVVLPRPRTTALTALPSVAGMAGPLACAANALTLAIEGADLLVAAGVGPVVDLVPAAPAPGPGGARRVLASQGAACLPVPFSRASLALCARVDAVLPTETVPGLWAVEVSVPLLAAAADPLPLVVDGVPSLAVPAGAPSVATAPLALDVVSGSGGIIVGPGGAPSVTLGGAPLAAEAVDCGPLPLEGYARCERLHATIPQGFASGPQTLAVTTASGCSRQASLFLAPPPVVTPPAPYCPGSGGIRLTGSGFLDPTVYLDGATPTALALEAGCPPASASCGEVVLRPLTLAPGSYQAFLVNASTPPVESARFPIVVGAGPPQVEDASIHLLRTGTARDVHVEVFELAGAVTGVSLLPTEPAGPPLPVDFVQDASGVTLTFPADAPENLYAVEVRDETSCPGTSHPLSGIRAVDDPVLAAYDFELDVLDVVTWWELETDSPTVSQLAAGGNPGAAAFAAGDGSAPWYFAFFGWGEGTDVGALRFDLRQAGGGNPTALPAVVLVNGAARLERALPAPAPDVWTSFDVPLDDATGWTFRDPLGPRPATVDDLRAAWPEVRVLGAWTDGPAEASLDDVVLELAP